MLNRSTERRVGRQLSVFLSRRAYLSSSSLCLCLCLCPRRRCLATTVDSKLEVPEDRGIKPFWGRRRIACSFLSWVRWTFYHVTNVARTTKNLTSVCTSTLSEPPRSSVHQPPEACRIAETSLPQPRTISRIHRITNKYPTIAWLDTLDV
ncbi:uncharacterized protein LOC143361938 [Halictus rubicundus]|uniref:uncharacterized protein LOC143361938 n=1 Tax=Halictus rubicundus TaxID=77578 RepID=UPI004035C876